MSSSSIFSLPKNILVPSMLAYVEAALPENYFVKVEAYIEGIGFPVYSYDDPDTRVAYAMVEEYEVKFDPKVGPVGDEFMKQMAVKYPEYDGNRVIWAIFYEWYGQYSMQNSGSSAEELLKGITPWAQQRNPVLCSFRACDTDGGTIITLTSQKIVDGKPGEDEGPIVVEMSCLESSRSMISEDERTEVYHEPQGVPGEFHPESEVYLAGPDSGIRPEDLDVLE